MKRTSKTLSHCTPKSNNNNTERKDKDNCLDTLYPLIVSPFEITCNSLWSYFPNVKREPQIERYRYIHQGEICITEIPEDGMEISRITGNLESCVGLGLIVNKNNKDYVIVGHLDNQAGISVLKSEINKLGGKVKEVMVAGGEIKHPSGANWYGACVQNICLLCLCNYIGPITGTIGYLCFSIVGKGGEDIVDSKIRSEALKLSEELESDKKNTDITVTIVDEIKTNPDGTVVNSEIPKAYLMGYSNEKLFCEYDNWKNVPHDKITLERFLGLLFKIRRTKITIQTEKAPKKEEIKRK
jgi:hypothetical protein